MSSYNVKECYYCKQMKRFYIRAGSYEAFEVCETCGRKIDITRDAATAKAMFPDVYKETTREKPKIIIQDL